MNPLRTIKATKEELRDGTNGACLACGEYTSGVEPDARRYACESYEARQVYGLEELLVMGLLDLDIDPDEEEDTDDDD